MERRSSLTCRFPPCMIDRSIKGQIHTTPSKALPPRITHISIAIRLLQLISSLTLLHQCPCPSNCLSYTSIDFLIYLASPLPSSLPFNCLSFTSIDFLIYLDSPLPSSLPLSCLATTPPHGLGNCTSATHQRSSASCCTRSSTGTQTVLSSMPSGPASSMSRGCSMRGPLPGSPLH